MRNEKDSIPSRPTDQPGARVSIVRAENYDVDEIREAVRRGIELIGGLDDIVKPGNRVFIKINQLPVVNLSR